MKKRKVKKQNKRYDCVAVNNKGQQLVEKATNE